MHKVFCLLCTIYEHNTVKPHVSADSVTRFSIIHSLPRPTNMKWKIPKKKRFKSFTFCATLGSLSAPRRLILNSSHFSCPSVHPRFLHPCCILFARFYQREGLGHSGRKEGRKAKIETYCHVNKVKNLIFTGGGL